MSNQIKDRIKKINKVELRNGNSVLYVMSRDQRVEDNHALIAAWKHSSKKDLKLIVLFNFYTKVKNRVKNQFDWMVEGLKEVEQELQEKGIEFIVEEGHSETNVQKIVEKENVESIYFDFSPLKGPRSLQKKIAKNINIPCYVVDTHNIVPVWITSNKEEYAARTIRPKINSKLSKYLVEPELLQKSDLKSKYQKTEWNSLLKKVEAVELKNYTPVVKSGTKNAKISLQEFIENKLIDYSELRNDPANNFLSNLSAYLHFGQLSALRIALEVNKYVERVMPNLDSSEKRKKLKESADSFLEELIIRKELSDNFCYYNQNYDNLNGAKDWAIQTLKDHQNDKREFIYSYKELEDAKTHDDAWNASQIQMLRTGKMHGYMRMYWCKKILEWTDDPETAIKYAIKLNDKYELDGYDPNGYVGILWSIAGIHDRGWTERETFGKIRYMNFAGLKRKFDIQKYIDTWTK